MIDETHARVAGLEIDARYVAFPKWRARLQQHARLHADVHVADRVFLFRRPRGRDIDAREQQRREADDEVIRAELLRCASFGEGDVHAGVAVLDGGDGTVAAHAVAELRGERVGQKLVAALEMKNVARKCRDAAQLADRVLPQAEERGDIAARRGLGRSAAASADETDRRIRRAVLREQIAEQHFVEMIETDAERLKLVGELRDVRREVERAQVGPAVRDDPIDLARVEGERLHDRGIGELRLGEPFSIDVPIHVLPAIPRQKGQVKFLDVAAILHVARICEVLGAHVGVEAVGQRIADRLHVPAGAARCLEHRDVVAALHQLERAAQPADAAAGDDDALSPRGSFSGRGVREHAGAGEDRDCLQGFASRLRAQGSVGVVRE